MSAGESDLIAAIARLEERFKGMGDLVQSQLGAMAMQQNDRHDRQIAAIVDMKAWKDREHDGIRNDMKELINAIRSEVQSYQAAVEERAEQADSRQAKLVEELRSAMKDDREAAEARAAEHATRLQVLEAWRWRIIGAASAAAAAGGAGAAGIWQVIAGG